MSEERLERPNSITEQRSESMIHADLWSTWYRDIRPFLAGMGSFSPRVHDILSISDEDYISPPLLPLTMNDPSTIIPCTSEVKEKWFFLNPEWTFLNHGAFGSVIRPVMNWYMQWQMHVERQPLRFFDRELMPLIAESTRRLASFLHYDRMGLVLLQNATTGSTSVLRSVDLKPEDSIFILSLSYGPVKTAVNHIANEANATVVQKDLPLFSNSDHCQCTDLTTQSILTCIKSLMNETIDMAHKRGGHVKLAVFDHVTSNTAIVMPIPEIVDICHALNVQVLVDGAHAPFMLDLNLTEVGADYYVGNCHKWLCNPKGCAFLAVREDRRDHVRPLIVSHGFSEPYSDSFPWTGLRDYSSYVSLIATLDFWEKAGIKRMRNAMLEMVRIAVDYLTDIWNTDALVNPDLYGTMALVRLPLKPASLDRAREIQNQLHHFHLIEVPVKYVEGNLYVRISAHIYNVFDDYVKLGKIIAINFC